MPVLKAEQSPEGEGQQSRLSPEGADAKDPFREKGAECIPCNLCGADDAVELYRRSDYRFEVDAVEWPLVQCRRCGLAYVNPRPSPGTIWRYYPSAFYDDRDRGILLSRYELQGQYLADLRPGSLLDIGCANGDWIRLMQERGWRVAGIEPSPNATSVHGLDIHNGSIESARYPKDLFDVVTAWAVFEHLHNPMEAFRHVHQWLKPGGRLIIIVTNIRSIASRLAYQEDVPRHLYVFSEKTLDRYAESVGLELRRVDHDTRFFGGSGRGVVRVRLFEMIGVSPLIYFRAMKLRWAARARRYPLLTLAIAPLAVLERVLLPDWLVCGLRLNGTIVATMQKPGSATEDA